MAISNKQLGKLNNKYNYIDKNIVAQKMLKSVADVGTIVVNIIGATGIAGFKFHVPQTEMVNFENEVTDHYIDTNSAIQDHIVQKPITITVSGLVGDYFYSNNEIEDMVALITPTLALVKEFLPNITDRTVKRLTDAQSGHINLPNIQIPDENVYLQLQSKKNFEFNIVDLFKLFQNLYKIKSAQTRAFIFFECLWKSRARFSVETTWKRYDNMIVQRVQAKRDNNADITEFSITFKQISLVGVYTETIEQSANRMIQARSPIANKGLENGAYVDIKSVGN